MKTSLVLAACFISVSVFGQVSVSREVVITPQEMNEYREVERIASTSFRKNELDSLNTFLKNYSPDDTIKVNALNELSRNFQWRDFHLSLAHADSALRLAQRLGYVNGVATANNLKGFCFWAFGDNDLAIKVALEASGLLEQQQSSALAESYVVLSRSYADLRESEKAWDYVRRATEVAEQTKDPALLLGIYNWTGVLHIVANNNDSALFYFTKSLEIARHNPVPRIELARIISNIGECHLKRNYQLAFLYFEKALDVARDTGNKTAEASILSIMGHAMLDRGKYAQADEYLQASLDLSKNIGLRRVLRFVYDGLVDLRVKQGRAEEGVAYLKKYIGVRDSLYGASKTRQVLELDARHEIDKKVQAIRLLEQESRIQAIWRNFLIGGLVLLLIFSYMIFRLQRSRARKANELLELQQMHNEKLTEVDKMKTQFFANISHEFRTPLSLILAPLEEELKKRAARNADTELLQLMRRNANRLLELVNQLLDLSKLEAGKMELRLKRSNFNAFMRVLATSFESWAQQKSINFVTTIDVPSEPLWFDQDKIEKIATNLLANAFKFTPAGGSVTLHVQLIKEPERRIAISISDTGKGIPLEEQNQIFLPFYQVKKTSEFYQPGTGLGLSLVRELVRLYGGTISLSSEPDKGTTIDVHVPEDEKSFQPGQLYSPEQDVIVTDVNGHSKSLPRVDNETADDAESAAEGKDSVLVTEDNVDLLNFIASILEPHYTVYKAMNGEDGVSMAMRFVPNLILSDLMMPGIDGIQLVEKVKQDERTSHIPVILLTAKNEPQSKLMSLKSGVDDYLNKPFSTEELLVRIHNLIEQRKQLAIRFRERILVPITPSKEDSLDDKFLQKVRSVVEANMGSFTFSVEQLAEETNLSRTQLLRKLKALTGLSPNEFIKDLRLKKAADLIRQKADTITQIGYTVGFNDQSYFTKCFKKQFGVTPTEYSGTILQK
jgi:signal transduction histidine kinase/DNA-binding response OmpR family regulator